MHNQKIEQKDSMFVLSCSCGETKRFYNKKEAEHNEYKHAKKTGTVLNAETSANRAVPGRVGRVLYLTSNE